MSGSDLNELILLPHQQALVRRVLEEVGVNRFYLEAPPGMGKSVALRTLAAEAVRRDPLIRVLFVAPMAVLVEQFTHDTSRFARVTKVDRFAFREMTDLGGRDAVFGSPGIYASTLPFARLPDVKSAFLSVHWDLLICDGLGELPDDSAMAGLLDELAAASARAVIVGSPHGANAQGVTCVVVHWDKAAAVDANGNIVGPPEPSNVSLSYPVSAEFYHLLQQALAGQGGLDSSEGTFAEALESSPAAAEMLALEHETRANFEAGGQMGRLAAQIMREIDTLHADEKLNALLSYVASLDPMTREVRVCVVTRFVQTAYYLSSALAEIAPVELSLAGHDRSARVGDGTAKILVGGLLSLGLRADLASTDYLIFYDGGGSKAALRLIEAANALGRSRALTVAILRPGSPALSPTEAKVQSQS